MIGISRLQSISLAQVLWSLKTLPHCHPDPTAGEPCAYVVGRATVDGGICGAGGLNASRDSTPGTSEQSHVRPS
uniref:Secreted protein n=1 Tax=Saimiri boliviensis boliviensis TaxID=39432 RepID=A0A2K6UVY9_SAIBB